MAEGSRKTAFASALLLAFLLGNIAFTAEGLLPACGQIDNLLTPCYKSIRGVRPQPVSPGSECCRGIRRFRFPGCLCVALVWDIGRTIDERTAVAALSLPASCGRPLPAGFNCTGFAR